VIDACADYLNLVLPPDDRRAREQLELLQQQVGETNRILHEALATGADPLHLALVFNIDHTNARAYANAARNLLSGPVPKDES